jgi:hypothetical protein
MNVSLNKGFGCPRLMEVLLRVISWPEGDIKVTYRYMNNNFFCRYWRIDCSMCVSLGLIPSI